MIRRIKEVLFTKNTLGSVFWFSLLGFLRPAIKIFLLPLYLVYLTPEDYGILALVTIFSSIVVILSNLRLDGAVRVFYFDFESSSKALWNYMSQIYTTILLMGIILMGVMLFCGPSLMRLSFSSDEVSFYPYGIISLSTAILTSLTSVYYIYLKNEVRLKEYFAYSISFILLTIGFQVYLIVFKGMGVLGVLYGSLISTALLCFVIVIRNSRLLNFKLRYKDIAPSIKFALPLVPFSFLVKFENQLDRLVLERFMNLDTVGLYALLVALVGLVIIFMVALENGVRPFLYRSLKRGGEESEKVITLYFNLFVLLGLLTLSGIIMVGSNLDLFTENIKYLSIRQFFVLAGIAAIPMVILRYLAMVLIYYKKTKDVTITTIIKTIIMVILMIYMVPQYGIAGAIIAVSISYLLNSAIFYWLINQYGAPTIRMTKAFMAIFLVVLGVLGCKYFIPNMALMGVVQFILIAAILTPFIIPVIKEVANQKLVNA